MKRCVVACDTAAGIVLSEVESPDDATIEDALRGAREALGECGVGWEQVATGIYGKRVNRGHVWSDGDRIELYRPLQLDPRARRRQRAAPTRRGKR